jgi:hypothetical protein
MDIIDLMVKVYLGIYTLFLLDLYLLNMTMLSLSKHVLLTINLTVRGSSNLKVVKSKSGKLSRLGTRFEGLVLSIKTEYLCKRNFNLLRPLILFAFCNLLRFSSLLCKRMYVLPVHARRNLNICHFTSQQSLCHFLLFFVVLRSVRM